MWIETEQETPSDIGIRALIYPIDGGMEVAEYLGEGWWGFWDFKVHGTDITHWMPLPPSPTDGSK